MQQGILGTTEHAQPEIQKQLAQLDHSLLSAQAVEPLEESSGSN